MKEKLQNIMQNLSRKRLIAIALVLALLVTSIPLSMLGDNTAYAKVGPNYGAVIGNSAKFNVSNFPDALVTNDPYNFDMNSWEDAGDVNNRVDFSNKDSLEDIANSYGELPLVITNYYHDEEQHSLWYKVEAGPGYELPSRIAEKPWVYQNDTRNYDDSGKTKGMPDALLIYETGATYVFDEEGNAISELDFYELDAHKLYAETTLQGSVDYQWQICSDGEWINIYKEDKKEFKLSWGMVKGLLDESLKVKFRVVATSTNKTIESAPVTVNFVQPVEGDSITYDLRNNSIENRQMLMETGENVSDTVTVTVKFIYGENGEQLDDDKVYTIQKNADLKDTFKLPEIAGYNAYLEDDTETIYTEYTIDEAVTGNKTITFKYWPAKVNYTVIYYWQNVEDDNYTEKERYTTQGFTGSLTEAEDKYYPGLYQLLYEEVPIASDGSTVIEVYYDRNYYKMTFDLDGGYGVQPIYARYGTEVNVSNPTKAGYEFVGWDDITNVGDGTPDGIENALPKNVPAYHTAFKAIWKATDNAKLTIVYWGENANDEGYSYLESQEVYAKPGAQLTFGTNQLVCSLEPHRHDNSCQYDCGLTVHKHGDSCYGNCSGESVGNHTHSTNCYTVTYISGSGNTRTLTLNRETSNSTINTLNKSTPWNNGIVKYNNNYYIKLHDVWYRLTRDNGSLSMSEQTSVNITYKNGCTGTHTHTDACLSCTTPVHSHVADCYACIEHTHTDNCYLQGANIDSTLWTFVKSDTVTVAADGSTVMNVYYDRKTFTLTFRTGNNGSTVATITDKWGASIYKKFDAAPFNTTYEGRAWQCTDTNKYGFALQTLDIMPKFNATFNLYNQSSTTLKTIYYYVENVGANVSHNSWPNNTNNFTLLKEVQTYFNYATYQEEYHEMVGFIRYSSNTAGFNSSSRKDFSNNKLNLYYLRDSFVLDFNNGEDVTRTETVEFEANLGTYSTYVPPVPERYEPGSVKFDGWYLNPQCTGNEYILSEHNMDAANLILYAKWTPVTHEVRFFADETTDRTDANVYTPVVDGQAVPFIKDIQHGSTIQGSNIPPDPTKGQYIFVGWFYEDANGNEQMWDFANTTVVGDTDIYAKWSSNTLVEYTVKFVTIENGKEVEIADRIIGSALGGNSKTFDAKGNNQLYDGYREGYFPTTKSHTIVMDLENPENNSFTFYYEKKDAVPYTVYYVTTKQEGSLKPVEINGVTYYIVADTKTVSDNKKAIVTETYKKVAGYLPDTYQQTLTIDPDGNNIIIFKYNKDEKNGMYVVHYMTENIDGEYIEHSIFEGRGEKGSNVDAVIKDIDNFTYNAGHKDNVLSGEISVEEVLELYVYYDRNEYPYKVQYLEEGTNKPLADDKLVSNKVWEEYVTEKAITIDGYTIVGDDTKSIQIRKDTENPTVNIITFYYAENKAALTIKKSYPKDADYSIDEHQTFIFTVKGVDELGNEKAKDIELSVTIHGAGEVKITDLPAGKYIVTENEDWSWRYDADANSKEVTLAPGQKTGLVEFTNTREKIYWLDGDHFLVNIFDGKTN